VIVIRYEHIKVVQHDIGNGITEPKFGMTDDNTPVVVKTYNGPEGLLVLFNEYFCYRLAIMLDIQMPISGVCLVDHNTKIYNECITPDQYGYGFYSTYLNKAVTLVETIIPLIKNKEEFFKILLFDHIIFNTDRNPGNLLVQYYKNNITLQVIDHSHVFINQAIWDATCLKRAIKEKDYFSTRVLDDNYLLYNMFFRNMSVTEDKFTDLKINFRNKITENALRNIISDIPKEWLPSDKDINALIEYLLYRIDHLNDICVTIINHLKH
jgi:hypothetical protein